MRPGSYEEWVRRYDTLSPADRLALKHEQQQLRRLPLFSVLLPVYNPQVDWLREAIASVQAQTYARWELCIADDASTDAGVRPFLETIAAADARVKVLFREANGHISACTNSTLASASGEWCALLDQDDVLSEHALSFVARGINMHPDAGLIYSDEDFLDSEGRRTNPFIKPDWNPELFLGQNYINHLGVYRTTVLREIGGFREGFEGSQDYDLVLRCIERLRPEQVRHIPRVLYHWRMVPGSLAEVRDAKPYAKDAARRALSGHLERAGIKGQVEPCPENIESHRVRYAVPTSSPKVAVIVYASHVFDPPRDFVGTMRERSSYRELQVVEVAAGASGAFPAAAINDAAARCDADVLVFLGSAVEITEPDWLDELVSQAMRPEVGAVGARVWNADDSLRHGGYLLGVGGIASSAHEGLPRGHPGFFNRTFLRRNCSAVSAECMAVRADVFRQLGGLDAAHLREAFHDIDFCLRAGEQGLQVVWTPYANPMSHAARHMPSPDDEQYMRSRWGAKLPDDPFYSPSLSLAPPAFELAFPPRWLNDWSASQLPAAAAPQPDLTPDPHRETRAPFVDRLRKWWRGARAD